MEQPCPYHIQEQVTQELHDLAFNKCYEELEGTPKFLTLIEAHVEWEHELVSTPVSNSTPRPCFLLPLMPPSEMRNSRARASNARARPTLASANLQLASALPQCFTSQTSRLKHAQPVPRSTPVPNSTPRPCFPLPLI